MAARTKPPSQAFLSEATREYILKYVARADKITVSAGGGGSSGGSVGNDGSPKKAGAGGAKRAAMAGTYSASRPGSAAAARGAVASAMASDAGRIGAGRSGPGVVSVVHMDELRGPPSPPGPPELPTMARLRSSRDAGSGSAKRASSASRRAASARPRAGGAGGGAFVTQSDSAADAISRELQLMGLEAPDGPQRDPLRRGGGFDLM
eukprot:356618-Chlamydomonas_euryale.AAC.4